MVLSRGGSSRACPFCGERIKAVAIRCRYCHADLEPAAGNAITGRQAEAVRQREERAREGERGREGAGEVEGSLDPGVAPAPTHSLRSLATDGSDAGSPDTALQPTEPASSRRRTIVLAAIVGVAAVLVVVLGLRAMHADDPSTIGGAGLDEAARTQVLVTAADLTQRTLSYKYDTLDQDMETAQARMTKEFRAEYGDTMAQVRDNTVKNKISLQATVVSASVVRATEHEADVLVFVNQTATAKDKDDPQLNRSSLIVTLTRGSGDWLLSDVEAVR